MRAKHLYPFFLDLPEIAVSAIFEGGTFPEYIFAYLAVNSAPQNTIIDEYDTHNNIRMIDPAAP